MKTLSITIPTYNRVKMLCECLDLLLPQAEKRVDDVEVIVIDNASVDETEKTVRAKYLERYSCVRYVRNESNLGYAGNQVKCIELAEGSYIAILCDDDAYIDGEVEQILDIIAQKEYAFVALNYYSFIEKILKPFQNKFAPDVDKLFIRAYDIMNYPSVGHYSGFVFNAKLAKDMLKTVKERMKIVDYEKLRGGIGELAIRVTAGSQLPSYFIGKRLLAARRANEKTVDYDSLYHLCLDYYTTMNSYFKEGIITQKDLDCKAELVLRTLPKAIMTNTPRMTENEISRLISIFDGYFLNNRRYYLICRPLFKLASIGFIRFLFRIIRDLFRTIKYKYLELRS